MGHSEKSAATKDAPTEQYKKEFVIGMVHKENPAATKDAPTEL